MSCWYTGMIPTEDIEESLVVLLKETIEGLKTITQLQAYDMKSPYEKPESSRGRFVYFLWFNMPRFILLAMFTLIIVLTVFIVGKFSAIKAAQEAAIKKNVHL